MNDDPNQEWYEEESKRYGDGGDVDGDEWKEALEKGEICGEGIWNLKITPRKRLLDLWFREGDTGFVYGPRGAGKTWLSHGMARAISKGKGFGRWIAGDGPVPVAYLDGEMPFELMQERDQGFGETNDNFHLISHELLFDRTEKVINIALPAVQKAITQFCLDKGIKALFLDNLSTLASGVAESDADDWEKLLGWLLDLRRKKIAVVIVHHAGRSGLMRGTSRREDSVFWIIKVDEVPDFTEAGCQFNQRFEKNRNAPRDPDSYTWTFRPDATLEDPYAIDISCEPCNLETLIVDRLRLEPTTAKTLMTELKVPHTTLYRALKRLEEEGVIEKKGQKYHAV